MTECAACGGIGWLSPLSYRVADYTLCEECYQWLKRHGSIELFHTRDLSNHASFLFPDGHVEEVKVRVNLDIPTNLNPI